MREREQDIIDLKSRLSDAENIIYNNQLMHSVYIHDFKKSFCVCFLTLLVFLLLIYLNVDACAVFYLFLSPKIFFVGNNI